MEPIRVLVPLNSLEFGITNKELADEAAEAIRSRIPDFEVEVVYPQGADLDVLQYARTLFVDVPWDSIIGAAAGVMLEALREMLTNRIKTMKEQTAKEGRKEMSPDYIFPENLTSQDREERRRATPFLIRIYGPGGQLLAVIEQTEAMEEAVINPNPPRD